MSKLTSLLNELSKNIQVFEEARGLLENIVIDDLHTSFFSIRFLVLSFNKSYLISPIGEKIREIDVSLKSLGVEYNDMKYISDINPLIERGEKCNNMYSHVRTIADSYVPINLFPKTFFGLNDINDKWGDNQVVLLFLVNKNLTNTPFYVFLISEFYWFVQTQDSWSYKDVYRIAEDAALRTLQKTLPIVSYDENMESKKFQKRYVILDLITRTMNDISALYYESSQCKGFFQFIGNKQDFRGISLQKKITLLSMNDRIIRKLLEAAKSFPLVVLEDDIIGISTKPIETDNKYTIHILGHLAWEYRINNKPQFICINSMYKFPIAQINENNISLTFRKLFNMNDKTIKQFLQVIKFSCEGNHGAMIVVSDNAKIESQRLCDFNRGIATKPFSIFNINKQIISDITSIDGALIIDTNGKCYSFGVILDGNIVTHGTPSRGARYNSAKNYISLKTETERNHKYMAIVISEDGMVNVFPSDEKDKNNYFSHFDVFKE